MALLSKKLRRRLEVALAHRGDAKELADAVDAAVDAATNITTPVADAVEDITVEDATDEGTAIALANANKAKINELLAALRDAGLMAE